MKGKKPIEDLNAGVRSAIRVEIYWTACEVLKVEGKQNRRGVLDALPEMIRPHIESEVRRLWEMRKSDET